MINILTLKVTEKYSSKYVNNLYYGLKKFSNIDFNFYCYTENKKGLDKNIIVIPLSNVEKYKLQWHKLIFHKNNFGNINIGEKCLILDIDWIIINNIDEILNYNLEKKRFLCFERWWFEKIKSCKINGGLQMDYMGDTNHLWEIFKNDHIYWQEYFINNKLAIGPVNGEQNFIDKHLKLKRQWLPMEWFGKYSVEEMMTIQKLWTRRIDEHSLFYADDEFDDRLKMIHFSNSDNYIENYKENWIKAHWE